MKAKITRYLIPLFILTIIITFSSFSCSTLGPADKTIEEPAQETTEEITVEEPEEEPAEEVVVEEPVEEEVAGEPEEALDESEEEEIVEEAEESSEEKETVTSSDLAGKLYVHFIDVGQGDSIFIDLGSEEVLIDGGGRSPGVSNYIREYVDDPLEVMIATHPHADHVGGLIKVLEDFQLEEIWLNGDTSTSKTYQDFMAAVNAEGAEVNQANRGGIISTESLIFSILNPPDTLFSETNNNSIVLRLEYGDTVFLFTGDAEKEAESSMLATEDKLWAQILKAGHHGSKTASSIEFLRKVNPDIAIISCGTGNRYGHPHDITLNNLSSLGVMIYRTDITGNIIVESDGVTYRVVEGDPFTYIEEKDQENEQDLSQEQQTEQNQEEEQQEEQHTISLSIFNGNGIDGYASKVSGILEDKYNILEIGNAAHFDYHVTEIRVYSDAPYVVEAANDIESTLMDKTTIGKFETIFYLTMDEFVDSDIIIVLGSL